MNRQATTEGDKLVNALFTSQRNLQRPNSKYDTVARPIRQPLLSTGSHEDYAKLRKLIALTGAAFTMLSHPLSATTYQYQILESYGFTGGAGISQDYSINDKGVVADPEHIGGSFVRRRDSGGNQSQTPSEFFVFPQINDAGAVLMSSSVTSGGGHVAASLEVQSNGGSRQILALQTTNAAAFPGQTVFKEIDAFGAAINDVGEVVASVTTLDDRRQIVKFAPSGGHEVIGESSNLFFLPPSGRLAINNSGTVAFIATEVHPTTGNTTRQAVWLAENNATLRLGATTPSNLGVSGDVDLNDRGDIVAGVIGTDAGGPDNVGYLFHNGVTDQTNVVGLGTIPTVGYVNGLNLNDYGQVAYTLGGKLYVDDVLILSSGDTPIGPSNPLVNNGPSGSTSPVGLRHGVSLNNSGQIVMNIQTVTGASPANFTILANPDGATLENPLVPFFSSPTGENDVALNIINGLGVEAPIWVDPIVATAFTYSQGVGGANFASVIIPDPLPLGDDTFLLEFLYGAGNLYSDTLMAGVTFDFTAFAPLGISEFTIGGIDVSEGIDPTDPFIVGLTFVSGGFQSTLSIDATTTNTDVSGIPTPMTGVLLLTGFGFAALGRRLNGRVVRSHDAG
jgi:hypothetical protein